MYVLIINPVSGRGKAVLYLQQIIAILHARKLDFRIERALEKSDATAIARRVAPEKPDGIIAVGGDGTLYEIINGMIGSDVPLLFVSCGTGNDFVRSLNLPSDPIEALKRQLDAPLRKIDVGRMNDTYFLNVAGTGFDVEVLRNTDRYKGKYSGLRAYMHGLVDAIKHYEPVTAMVSIDGAPETQLRFAIISIGNGRYIGGGMKAVPGAVIDDGLFDVVIVNPVKKRTILPLIAFFIAGLHVAVGLGRKLRCHSIRIRREGMTVNLDGELSSANDARFELLPGALNVRVP